jgi:competence protein ComEC
LLLFEALLSTFLAEWFPARPLFWGFGAAAGGALLAGAAWAGPWYWGLLALGALAAIPFAWRRGMAVALPFLLALAAGAGIGARRAGSMPPGDVGELCGRHVIATGVVVTEPEPVGSPPEVRWRFLLQCDAARTAAGMQTVSGRLAVTAERAPPFGARLAVSGIPRRPRGRSNPGGRSRADYWRLRGVFATLSQGPAGWRSFGSATPAAGPGWASRFRQQVLLANQRDLSPLAAFMTSSIVLGRPGPAPGGRESGRGEQAAAISSVEAEKIETAFRRSGTIHILVVSGSQVTLLLLPLLWLCRRWLWLRRAAALLAIPACISYALVAGAEASLLRAACMGALMALALSCWRDPDFLNVLGFAGLCLLAINPLLVHDLGFLLSFAAVWGVVVLGPLFYEAMRRRIRLLEPGLPRSAWGGLAATALRWLLVIVAAAAGAYLATAPLLSYFVQSDAPVSVLANVPAVLLATGLLNLGFLHALLAMAGTPPHWLSQSINWLAEALWRCVSWFAALAGEHVAVYPLPLLLAVAIFLLFALAAGRGRHRLAPALACLAAAIVLLEVGERAPALASRRAEVTFLDVGQGDATFIRLPDGKTMLVDGGGLQQSDFDVGEKVVLPALRALRVPRLDLVVATHPHEDHIGGLPAVVEAEPVGLFFDSGQSAASPTQARLLRDLAGRRVRFRLVQAGQRFSLGDCALEVLGPPRPYLAGTRSDLNSNSIVLRLGIQGRHVLLPGDAELPAEAMILARGGDLSAEVLKLGHHGSAFSTSDAWLRAVQPRVAIACCGVENRFGHPSPETVERVRAAGVRFHRTDQDGAVTVSLHPDGLRVRSELTGEEEWLPDRR